MTTHGDLFHALINGLDESDRARTAQLIARDMRGDLDAVGGHPRRRVDYGTRHRRSGLTYQRGRAAAPDGAGRPDASPGAPASDDRREESAG